MSKLTPLQEVREKFGSKEALADKLLPLLERDENEEEEDLQHRLRTASNKQLLRLLKVHETLKEKYGTKEDLVNKLVLDKFPKGNDLYREKLMKSTPSRLLDAANKL